MAEYSIFPNLCRCLHSTFFSFFASFKVHTLVSTFFFLLCIPFLFFLQRMDTGSFFSTSLHAFSFFYAQQFLYYNFIATARLAA